MRAATISISPYRKTQLHKNHCPYVKLIMIPHQRIMQQVAVHLRLDEHQVDEHDDIVMLDVLVAKVAAFLAHRQPNIVLRPGPSLGAPCTRVLRP
jgi:hypothetical protein